MCQLTLFSEAGLDSEDVRGTDMVRRSEQQTSPTGSWSWGQKCVLGDIICTWGWAGGLGTFCPPSLINE